MSTKKEAAPAKKAAPKKAAKKEKPTFELAKIDVNKLPEFQGWKTKLQKIDKDNPVITEIEDFKTYEEAKKRRHARRLGRYEVQNSDKEIAAAISKIRKQAGALAEELIEIVKPGEDAQHEVIQAYEDRKAAEAEEKRLEEEARQNELKTEINNIFEDFADSLEAANFEDLTRLNNEFLKLEEADREDFEDFEWLYLEKLDAARLDLQKTEARLEKEEADRKERARLELQNARLQKLAPVNHFGIPSDLNSLAELSEEKFNKILAEKRELKLQAEEKQAARDAEEKARKKTDEEKQAAQEKELQELREMKAKAEAEKLDFRKNILLNYGFREEATGNPDRIWNYITEEIYLIKDILELSEVGFNDLIQDQQIAIKEADKKAATEDAERLKKELAEKQVAEAEAKKQKAAEAKRLKALQPDKKKLIDFINSLQFNEDAPEYKSEEIKMLALCFFQAVKNLKENFINDANNLK